MRILVVGAGALGGYFGGRLKDAGRDVTFLVRPRRAEQLAKTGLVIRSPRGDANIPQPATILAENLRAPFDLILLSCKAYDLQSAMDSFAPAVGANTAILPLLNGMKHMDLLAARFGADAMLGGQCVISATLDPQGHVLHLNDLHFVSYGEQIGPRHGNRGGIFRCKIRVAALHDDHAGNVGEVGDHCSGRGDHLRAARRSQRHHGRRRRPIAGRFIRGVLRDRCG